MDTYFSTVNDIINRRTISKRVQFVLQDVVDLRDNQWVPRQRQDAKVKTIDQIHREAEDEEQMTKQLASQYTRGDGRRKVGVGDMDVEVLVRIIMSVYVLSDNDVIGVYCVCTPVQQHFVALEQFLTTLFPVRDVILIIVTYIWVWVRDYFPPPPPPPLFNIHSVTRDNILDYLWCYLMHEY